MRFASGISLVVVLASSLVADTPPPPLAEAFSSFAACTTDGYAYMYGGHAGMTHTYSTETTLGKFRRLKLADPKGGWEELPGGVACQGLALVAHGGKVYRLGGMRPRNAPGEKADNSSLASCGVYDPKTNKWEPLPDLPAGRSPFDAAVVGDTLVAVGGWQMTGTGKDEVWHDNAVLLDLTKRPLEWEAVPQPFKRRALNVGAADGKVCVVGGLTDDNQLTRRVDVFDVAARTSAKGPDLPGGVMNGFTPAVTVLAGRMYASPADGVVYRLADKADGCEAVGSLAVVAAAAGLGWVVRRCRRRPSDPPHA